MFWGGGRGMVRVSHWLARTSFDGRAELHEHCEVRLRRGIPDGEGVCAVGFGYVAVCFGRDRVVVCLLYLFRFRYAFLFCSQRNAMHPLSSSSLSRFRIGRRWDPTRR
ncbi:hypothetical protein GSI_14302 [Ganoderma sinense ZZ0214-1]|uniref:Uncharacterized protein n=1 Tax=Ganoderma sinense ZZ0214-1 TaxID=1077348 RepID=A0A2G8RNA1_9APHY|nr:hypothetical protein GSI_14302 [Ganoderma sinense ZZ0214-1]